MVNKHVLVIGDAILDETIISSTIGVSLETPTLKAQFANSSLDPGGAANVVQNLLTLGANVTFVTVLGEDQYTDFYNNWTHPKLKLVSVKDGTQNIVKTRFWLKHGDSMYKHLQINRGQKKPCSQHAFERLLNFTNIQEDVDCVLLVDYSINIFNTESRVTRIVDSLKRLKKPIIASSQISDNENKYSWFSGVEYMCMNRHEALENVRNFHPEGDKMLELSSILNSNICVTLGSDGAIFIKDKKTSFFPAYKVDSIDPCGAGDAFLAAFSVFLEDENIDLCNKWAALSTKQIGTKCAPREALYA